jgi:hypothetical protein
MKRTAAVSVALLLLMLGYAVWSWPGATPATLHGTAPPPAFGGAQRQAFAVLNGSTHPVPRALQERLRRARNPEVRTLRLDAAKYLATASGLWVANGRGVTCIVQAHGGAVSCVPRATLLQEGVALGVVDLGPPPDREPQEFIVAGIVPDRFTSVRLSVGSRERTIAVRDNAYSLRAAVPILVERFDP